MEVGLACGAGCAAGLALLYRAARPYFSAKVNCHFCNSDFKVAYHQRNSFTCPHCEQYNGWDERGDYDRPLETPQNCRYVEDQNAQTTALDNGLCRNCNLNQELKVAQLAASSSDGVELEEYRRHLERVYRLCPVCEDVVGERLGQQDRKFAPALLQFKLERSRLNWSIHGHDRQGGAYWLKAIPPYLQTLFSVILFFSLQEYKCSLPFLEPYLDSFNLPAISLNIESPLHTSLGLLILFTSIIKRSLFPILLHVSLLSSLLIPDIPHVLQLSLASVTVVSSVITSEFLPAPPNQTSLSSNTSTRHTNGDSFTARVASNHLQADQREETQTHDLVEDKSEVASKKQSFVPEPSEQLDFCPPSPLPIQTFSDNSINHEFAINNDDCDLSSLSLGEVARSPSPRSPFASKVYSPDSPTNSLFSPSGPLLRPSKLTATSWVAGGYWTPPGATEPVKESLSRSSSQSSGFVSATPSIINFGNHISPPPSLHNGFCSPGSLTGLFPPYHPEQDKFSVLSEPTYRVSSPLQINGLQRRQYATSYVGDFKTNNIGPPPRRPTLDDKLSDCSEQFSQQATAASAPKAWMTAGSPNPWTLTITITPCGVLLVTSIAVNVTLALLWAGHL